VILCNLCLLGRFVASRVTNWDGVRPSFRAAWVMRAISSWVASTRTRTTSHLLNLGSPLSPRFKVQGDSGLEAAAGKAFERLEPRVAGKVSRLESREAYFYREARHGGGRNKPPSTAKPLKAADGGLAPSKWLAKKLRNRTTFSVTGGNRCRAGIWKHLGCYRASRVLLGGNAPQALT
jgi:hypothetical protein